MKKKPANTNNLLEKNKKKWKKKRKSQKKTKKSCESLLVVKSNAWHCEKQTRRNKTMKQKGGKSKRSVISKRERKG